MNITDMINQIDSRRGPIFGRGAGKPFNGVVEDTPCFWISWIVSACKIANEKPDKLQITFFDTKLTMTTTQLTFGTRFYWLCPRCARRCEAVYYVPKAVGCRTCLHLGYRSQCHRKDSIWLCLERMYDRSWPFGKRYYPDENIGQAIVDSLRENLEDSLKQLIEGVKVEAI